jgi:hypothetical protein
MMRVEYNIDIQDKGLRENRSVYGFKDEVPSVIVNVGNINVGNINVFNIQHVPPPQVEMMPTGTEIEFLVTRLPHDDLKTLSCGFIASAVEAASKGQIHVDAIVELNGWLSTMEETLDAGDTIDELLARRDDADGYIAATPLSGQLSQESQTVHRAKN